MQAALTGPQAVRLALVRPFTRSLSSKAAASHAPWAQQRLQPDRGSLVAQARNRLAELLADMKADDVEEDTSTPAGDQAAHPRRRPSAAPP